MKVGDVCRIKKGREGLIFGEYNMGIVTKKERVICTIIHKLGGKWTKSPVSYDRIEPANFPYDNPLNRKLYPNRIPVVYKDGKLIRVDPDRVEYNGQLLPKDLVKELEDV